MNKKLECILAENNGLVRNRLDDMYRWGIKRNDTIFMDFTSPETPDTLRWLKRVTGLSISVLIYEVYGVIFDIVYFWEEDDMIKFPNKHPFKNKLQMSKEEFWNEVENAKV